MEAKCPFAGRREKIKPGKYFSFLETVGGKIQLKRSHGYYHQVTAEMMLAGKKTCYFIVYTLAPDLFVEEIKLDEEFFMTTMLPKLKFFFEEHYLDLAAKDIMK